MLYLETSLRLWKIQAPVSQHVFLEGLQRLWVLLSFCFHCVHSLKSSLQFGCIFSAKHLSEYRIDPEGSAHQNCKVFVPSHSSFIRHCKVLFRVHPFAQKEGDCKQCLLSPDQTGAVSLPRFDWQLYYIGHGQGCRLALSTWNTHIPPQS